MAFRSGRWVEGVDLLHERIVPPVCAPGRWAPSADNRMLPYNGEPVPPPVELSRLRVVLVAPRNPLNIGAAARAMSNFGFRRCAS